MISRVLDFIFPHFWHFPHFPQSMDFITYISYSTTSVTFFKRLEIAYFGYSSLVSCSTTLFTKHSIKLSD